MSKEEWRKMYDDEKLPRDLEHIIDEYYTNLFPDEFYEDLILHFNDIRRDDLINTFGYIPPISKFEDKKSQIDTITLQHISSLKLYIDYIDKYQFLPDDMTTIGEYDNWCFEISQILNTETDYSVSVILIKYKEYLDRIIE